MIDFKQNFTREFQVFDWQQDETEDPPLSQSIGRTLSRIVILVEYFMRICVLIVRDMSPLEIASKRLNETSFRRANSH